jgi:hypothetical protein
MHLFVVESCNFRKLFSFKPACLRLFRSAVGNTQPSYPQLVRSSSAAMSASSDFAGAVRDGGAPLAVEHVMLSVTGPDGGSATPTTLLTVSLDTPIMMLCAQLSAKFGTWRGFLAIDCWDAHIDWQHRECDTVRAVVDDLTESGVWNNGWISLSLRWTESPPHGSFYFPCGQSKVLKKPWGGHRELRLLVARDEQPGRQIDKFSIDTGVGCSTLLHHVDYTGGHLQLARGAAFSRRLLPRSGLLSDLVTIIPGQLTMVLSTTGGLHGDGKRPRHTLDNSSGDEYEDRNRPTNNQPSKQPTKQPNNRTTKQTNKQTNKRTNKQF